MLNEMSFEEIISPSGHENIARFGDRNTREALRNLLELSQSLLLQGKSTEQVLEVMMPS